MTINPIIIISVISAALIIVVIFFIAASRNWHESAMLELKKRPVYEQISQHLARAGISEHKGIEVAQHLSQIIDTEVNKESQKIYDQVGKIIHEKNKKVEEVQAKIEVVEKSYERLGKQKGQTESVVRSIAKGVIVLDDEGKVVYLNETAERILGEKKDSMMGQKIGSIEGSHVVSLVNEEGVEVSQPTANKGEKENLKENMAVIETVHGQTKGMISILPSREQKQKVEDLKNEFLSNITHELRSPLICIQKSLLVLSERIPPTEQQYLSIASRNAARLEKLVNDILDLSKLESGEIHLRYEIFTLKAMIEELRWNFFAWANEKQIQIDVEIPGDLTVIEGDHYRLGQVIANFMSNAIKFTPRNGRIVLSAKRLIGSGDKPDFVEIGVRDSGSGIDPEEQKSLFKKFAHVSTRPTENERGTGIGLSISKQIVDLHKGRIWVDSKPGHGSYFAFAVPMRKV